VKRLLSSLTAIALSLVPSASIAQSLKQPVVPGKFLYEVEGRTSAGQKLYYGGVVQVKNGVTVFIYGIEGNPLRVGYLSCDRKIWIVDVNWQTTLVVRADSEGSRNLVKTACEEAEFIHIEATSNVK
jgi:hypothetical protein